MSLGEIVLLLIVGIIVVGPRKLPSMMRTAGQWVARLRRMATDLRSQSGIDDVLRTEGLDQHLHELRSLSRFNMVETLMAPAASPGPAAASPYNPPSPAPGTSGGTWGAAGPLREREYPLIGCDAYGALPDDVPTYRTMAAAAARKEEAAPAPADKASPGGAESPAGGGESSPPAGDHESPPKEGASAEVKDVKEATAAPAGEGATQ